MACRQPTAIHAEGRRNGRGVSRVTWVMPGGRLALSPWSVWCYLTVMAAVKISSSRDATAARRSVHTG
jgi:hypothetical protein